MKRTLLVVLLAVGLLAFTTGPAVAADGISTQACTTPNDISTSGSFSTEACTTPNDVSLQCGGGDDDDDGGSC